MYVEVVAECNRRNNSANFFAISFDELATVDPRSWIFVHVYIIEDWVRVLYLVALKEIKNAPTSDVLIQVILVVVEDGNGLELELISKKIVCFRGASTL